MDFIRAALSGDRSEGIEVDIESQLGAIDSKISKKRTKKGSTNKKQDVPLNISVFNEMKFAKGNDPATESDTSESSSDEENESPATRIIGDGMGSSKLPSRNFISSDENPDKHLVWFSHGKCWTVFGILFAWTGLVCASEARNTTSFVSVESPIYIDTNFNEIHEVGMLKFMLCVNETKTGVSGCSLQELEVDDVNDQMFQIARSMAFLSVLMGGFLAACITLSVVWHSINLRPVGVGFLFAYFFQSCTFLFFDTKLCGKHTCHISEGTIFSIVASFCWILACVASSRMDAFKYHQKRAQELAHRRTNPGKPSVLDRGISDVTKETEASYDSTPPMAVNTTPKRSGRCLEALMRDLKDFEDSEDWRTRPHTPTSRGARTDDAPKRRGRSVSSKRGSRCSTAQNRSRGNSLDLSHATGKRSVSVSQRAPDDIIAASSRSHKHLARSARSVRTKSRPKSWEKESPGRKAMRTHSQNRSKKLDTRHFEL